jgi:hypothetical protein
MVDLQGRMVEGEALVKEPLQLEADAMTVGAGLDQDVRR